MKTTKDQHFVPRTYLRAWETSVNSNRQPDNFFTGVFTYSDAMHRDGVGVDGCLYHPRLYCISFISATYYADSWEQVRDFFAEKLQEILLSYDPPIHVEYDGKSFSDQKSLAQFLSRFGEWHFRYNDGNQAPEKKIMNRLA